MQTSCVRLSLVFWSRDRDGYDKTLISYYAANSVLIMVYVQGINTLKDPSITKPELLPKMLAGFWLRYSGS